MSDYVKIYKDLERELLVKQEAVILLENLKIMIKEYKHVDLISEIDEIIELLEEVNYGD